MRACRGLGSVLAVVLVLPLMPARAGGDFVGRAGTGFTWKGKPFRVAGTHIHYAPWGTKAEVDAALDDARALGFNVVRFFVTSFQGSNASKIKPTIWGWPSASDSANMKMRSVRTVFWDDRAGRIGFDDGPDGFGRVDYAIRRAGDLGLKLDIAFLDFWQYAGGSQQIRAWYGSVDNLGQTGLGAMPRGEHPNERYTFFFEDPRCRDDYKRLVAHILNRRNPLTGLAYKDDPTIFAWDLMNEPAMLSKELALSWKREMAGFVKTIDRNHLLCAGSEGFYNGSGGNDPVAELAIADLDFGTWHTYPSYHDLKPADVLDLIARHAADARQAGKPVLLQEFGYRSDQPDQAEVYQRWLAAINANPDAAGWISWRLTGRMDGGGWPQDNGERFDIHHDGSPLANTLSTAARTLTARNSP